LGRVIRHKNDYGLVFLFERRYYIICQLTQVLRHSTYKFLTELPSWIRDNLVRNDKFEAIMKQIPLFFDRGTYVALQTAALRPKSLNLKDLDFKARRQVPERDRAERKQIKISKEIFYEPQARASPNLEQLPPDPENQSDDFLDNSEVSNNSRMFIEKNNQPRYQLNSHSIIKQKSIYFLETSSNSNSNIELEKSSGFCLFNN